MAGALVEKLTSAGYACASVAGEPFVEVTSFREPAPILPASEPVEPSPAPEPTLPAEPAQPMIDEEAAFEEQPQQDSADAALEQKMQAILNEPPAVEDQPMAVRGPAQLTPIGEQTAHLETPAQPVGRLLGAAPDAEPAAPQPAVAVQKAGLTATASPTNVPAMEPVEERVLAEAPAAAESIEPKASREKSKRQTQHRRCNSRYVGCAGGCLE